MSGNMFLNCPYVRCELWWCFKQDWFIAPDDSCKTLCWNSSKSDQQQIFLLWLDEIHKFCRYVMCVKKNDMWCPTCVIKCYVVFLMKARPRNNMLVCISSCLLFGEQCIQKSHVEILLRTWMINYIRPSMQNLEHVFEELGVRTWSWTPSRLVRNFPSFCLAKHHWQAPCERSWFSQMAIQQSSWRSSTRTYFDSSD